MGKKISKVRIGVVLIGLPLVFVIVSIITKDWRYLTWSIPPALMSCWTAFVVLRKQEES
ncbi:hypothetical protein [Priestia flexa]|uniref:hypothetical protein n=1 Tax=Priestia flexa TaxID=86664 RepID=UPI003FD48A28